MKTDGLHCFAFVLYKNARNVSIYCWQSSWNGKTCCFCCKGVNWLKLRFKPPLTEIVPFPLWEAQEWQAGTLHIAETPVYTERVCKEMRLSLVSELLSCVPSHNWPVDKTNCRLLGHCVMNVLSKHCVGWWRGVAATRCVESTKLLHGGPG